MSKRNYSQYSNKNNKPKNPEATKTDENVVDETFDAPYVAPVNPEIKIVEETVETVALPKMVEGVVNNCAKLNVRANPNTDAEVLCILDAMSEISIDVTKSTNDWVFVCTASGVEGYCMKQFIEARL